MTVLYILSGKNGITSFTNKELELLEEKGIQFILLFTKYLKTNIVPKKHWNYVVVSHPAFFLFIFKNLFTIIFSTSFYESIRQKELRFFLVALYFRSKVKIDGPFNIHVQMGDHKLVIGYYLQKFGKGNKLSTTIHAHELYSDLRYNNLSRFHYLLESCDKIFTISHFNKNILINDIRITENKIEVMYLYPSFKKEGFATKKRILMTGNWERKKGFEEVLTALAGLNRDDFVLFIAGKAVNPEVDLDMHLLIKGKGLESKVKLLGQIDKTLLEIMYSYCDLFLLPSKTEYFPDGNPKEREGIPVAIIEAMSFGLPIISSRHAGIPELVDKYLIDEGNVNQLQDLLKNILDNIVSIKKEGKSNVETIDKKFSYKNIDVLSQYFKN